MRTTARLAALVVWLYPPLAGLIFGDVHENGFAPAAVAWTLYAFDAGRLGWSAFFAAVALAVKEDQALFLAFAGAVRSVRVSRRPAARDFRGRRRGGFGRRCRSVLRADPTATRKRIRIGSRRASTHGRPPTCAISRGMACSSALGFLVLILAPLAFVPLRTRVALLAVPPLLEVLGSRMSTTFTLGTHYAGAWIGYLLVAYGAGIAALAARGKSARAALYWSLALCVLELLVANPLHPGTNLRAVQPRDVELDAALRDLPRDVSVATQEEAYTHLGLTDPFARLLPEDPNVETHACLVLIDRAYPDSPRLQEYGDALTGLVASGKYVAVVRLGDIAIFRRITPCR